MKRPRLLYLAYHFPPAPAIGSVRAWNSARQLAARGWDVSIVTPQPSVWKHPDEPERFGREAREAGLKLVLTGHRLPMLAPDHVRWIGGRAGWALGGVCRVSARALGLDSAAGWTLSAERACASFAPGEIDLVLATGGPYSSFALARRVARRLGAPYVLDYRDPWTANPHTWNGRRSASALEASLLRDCAAATVVSPSWAELIGGTFHAREKLRVVSNGFEPRMFADVSPRRFDDFTVVYAGTLYPPKRVLDPVLLAFRGFCERSQRSARFHYYGNFAGAVAEAADRLGVASRVVVHERVSRREALEAQKGADLLVVVASVDDDGPLADRGTVTGKVFDCMALERPSLVVAPRGSDLYEIARRAGGMRCFRGSQIDEMAAYMREVSDGRAPRRGDPGAYRWDAIGAELDAVLRGALGVKA